MGLHRLGLRRARDAAVGHRLRHPRLRADVADPRWQRPDAGPRLRILADAYGLDEGQRRDLVPLLARRTRAMHGFLARQAAAGTEPWSGLWEAGHGEAWRADTAYLEAREAAWASALLA